MAAPRTDVVVIGFGSDLRGDDAVGRRAAEAVEALSLPGVTVRSVHQLMPELAADLDGCRRAVFVDAATDGHGVEVRRVAPAAGDRPFTHRFDPPALLALAATLRSVPEEAVVVTVPAPDLRLGTTLSAAATEGLRDAVDRVVGLCRDAAAAGAPTADGPRENLPAQRKFSRTRP